MTEKKSVLKMSDVEYRVVLEHRLTRIEVILALLGATVWGMTIYMMVLH